MNVLYDISGLGTLLERRAGTGVPRVIENVLRALAVSKPTDCRVTACAPTDPHRARPYFRDHFNALPVSLSPAPADGIPGRWIGRVNRSLFASVSRRSWPYRLLRGVGLPVIRRTDAFFSRLSPGVLRDTDVYHSPHGAIPFFVRANRTARPQVALTVYDLIPFRHPEFFLPGMAEAQTAILRTTRPDKDWYLCISECTKRDLCELFGIDPKRVFVTPLAADTDVFYPCERDVIEETRVRYGLGRDAPYLMSLCTLEPRKNVVTIIEAFAEIVRANEVPGLQLLLVGGKGWLDESLRFVLERNREIRSRIILPGFIPDQDLAPLYSGALCFAYLSYYEGFGLPPLEAMQCGTPALVANTSSLVEVMGEAGLLFQPRDVDGFAHGVVSLWRNPAMRAELSRRALARARTFSWARCAQDTMNAYRAILGGGLA